ncbi:hypothetical protein [Alcanivorax sp. 1008]|uniref:hypothetical protein n=1 Tax=Alcanivorax sp. 1008 TaxID=2816853 RepID=UPI001D8173D6|nr:hypothetical protein [Alcanivorax sp. 1008]MCC1498333.1 hypothetical protein [Alcanivorax sp. 1008]
MSFVSLLVGFFSSSLISKNAFNEALAGFLLDTNLRVYHEIENLEACLDKSCIDSAKDYVGLIKGGVGAGVYSYYEIADKGTGDKIFSRYGYETGDFLTYRELHEYRIAECP